MVDNERRKNNMVYPSKFMVCNGSLRSGYNFYGPFDDQKKAGDWAEDTLMDTDWEIILIRYVKDES